jgi:hypothetical protein
MIPSLLISSAAEKRLLNAEDAEKMEKAQRTDDALCASCLLPCVLCVQKLVSRRAQRFRDLV